MTTSCTAAFQELLLRALHWERQIIEIGTFSGADNNFDY